MTFSSSLTDLGEGIDTRVLESNSVELGQFEYALKSIEMRK